MSELLAYADGQVRPIPIGFYPDGMPLITHANATPLPQRLLLRPSSLANFMAAMFYVDALEQRGCCVPELILPSMPGARQDRLSSAGDYLFTVKSIAWELSFRHFPKITIIDPHSEVTPALLDRQHVVTAADCITTPPGKYAAVISPDAGAEKRAGAVARKLGVPLLHAWKTRSVESGAITGFGMEPTDLPAGSLFLVVDDMCDGGATFIGLADVLDRAGLKAHLWVTHGLFTKGTARLLERYGHVYCTDSVSGPRDGVIEINVCQKLLENGIL